MKKRNPGKKMKQMIKTKQRLKELVKITEKKLYLRSKS